MIVRLAIELIGSYMAFSFKLAVRIFDGCFASISGVARGSLAAMLAAMCGLAVAQCPFNVTGNTVADALRDGLALTRAGVSTASVAGASS